MFDDSERWLPVVGYDGYYEVSSLGRVRSVGRVVRYRDGRKPRFFPAQLRKTNLVKGYPHLMLKRQDGGRNVYVHTLVCEAFYGPRPKPDWEVRHLNGNPIDNRASNLRWGTKKENAQDSIRHGTNKGRNKTHCKRNHPFDEENTFYSRSGGRSCRTCARAARRANYPKHKVAKSVYSRRKREQRALEEGRRLRTHAGALYHQLDLSYGSSEDVA